MFLSASIARSHKKPIYVGFFLAILMASLVAEAQQRVRIPTAGSPAAGVANPGWSTSGSLAQPVPPAVPNATLNPQIVPFDPYAIPSAPVPLTTSPPYGLPAAPPPNALPYPPGNPTLGVPPYGGAVPPANLPPALPAPYGSQPPAPLNGSASPPQPTPVFPEGINWNSGLYQRLFQDTGFRYTYLYGDDDGAYLDMHDIEVSTTVVLQNFARSATGLRITPAFIFHFLDGPDNGSDLPAQLYSTYLDAAWLPQFTPQFRADLAFRVGVYSDFQTLTTDSLRFTGRGLGVVQMTPTTALKLGVEYLDRLRVKLLPAGGVYWQPNAQTYFDIYFPRPKFSRYWTTMGNSEVWWYIGGEYGGGSWTMEHKKGQLAGASDRIDINDIRLFVGIDWSYLDRRSGFMQIGYVFDRELIHHNAPWLDTDLDNTFTVGGGIRF